MQIDARDRTYHCITCRVDFTLEPNRTYLVAPIHCRACEVKMFEAMAAAFDACDFFGTLTEGAG